LLGFPLSVNCRNFFDFTVLTTIREKIIFCPVIIFLSQAHTVTDLLKTLLGNGSVNMFQHAHATNNTVEVFCMWSGRETLEELFSVWSAHATVEELCILPDPCRVYITGVCL
jgi:hypothetical protein